MKPIKHTLTHSDEYQNTIYQLISKSDSPKASVIILHGVAEHHARYQEFTEFLCKNDFDTYIYNHRGHGSDKKWDELGMFSPKYGYRRVVIDAIEIIQYIKEHSRSNKIILFGHSMGSLIARNVIQYYDNLDVVILCGTTYPPSYMTLLGIIVTGISKLIHGPGYYSKTISKLLFESKRYIKISERTKYDWLTRDNPEVGKYIHDPYCGFICTSSLYNDLIKLTKKASNIKLINRTRHDLPILIISGTHDPVGNYGKEVSNLYLMYQKLGFNKVDCILYEECRHELLNELNRTEIMNDINHWIINNI